MRVFPERMLRNLESTQGLVFSGQFLQDLVEKGMPRDDAYKAVQENAMAAWETETSFRDRVAADARIAKYLDAKALAHTFDLQRQLRYVDAIFDRVFGAHPAGEKSADGHGRGNIECPGDKAREALAPRPAESRPSWPKKKRPGPALFCLF